MSINTSSAVPRSADRILENVTPDFVQGVTHALRQACQSLGGGLVVSRDIADALGLPESFVGQDMSGADFSTRIAHALQENDPAVLTAYAEAAAF